MKKSYVFTLNAEPLFFLEKSFINFFYEYINKISKMGDIILCTDLNYNNAVKLSKLINMQSGYIITSCGSSIYDVANNKCITSSYIKKNNLLPLLRQSIINTDSIVLHSKESLLIYSSSFNLNKFVSETNEKIDTELTHDYEKAKKFLNKNKVEYIEIYNHNFGTQKYNENEERIKEVSNQVNLFFNRILDNRIIITDTSFQNSIDFIYKNSKEDRLTYLINLTEIFKDQKINADVKCDVKYNLDFLFKNKTFYMFNESLQSSLLSSGILVNEEEEYVQY